MMGALEALQGCDAPPPPPLGARLPGDTPNQPVGLPRSQRALGRIPVTALVPQASCDHDDGQQRPRGDGDRQHGESDAKNEVVHLFLVVVLSVAAVPRTRDPRVDGLTTA
jgi:hypothetical protein